MSESRGFFLLYLYCTFSLSIPSPLNCTDKPTVGPLILKSLTKIYSKNISLVYVNFFFLSFVITGGGSKFLFGIPGCWARGEEDLSAPRQFPQPSGSWAEGYGPPQS